MSKKRLITIIILVVAVIAASLTIVVISHQNNSNSNVNVEYETLSEPDANVRSGNGCEPPNVSDFNGGE